MNFEHEILQIGKIWINLQMPSSILEKETFHLLMCLELRQKMVSEWIDWTLACAELLCVLRYLVILPVKSFNKFDSDFGKGPSSRGITEEISILCSFAQKSAHYSFKCILSFLSYLTRILNISPLSTVLWVYLCCQISMDKLCWFKCIQIWNVFKEPNIINKLMRLTNGLIFGLGVKHFNLNNCRN